MTASSITTTSDPVTRLETADGATIINPATAENQAMLIGHVDGIETLITSTNTKLDTINTSVGLVGTGLSDGSQKTQLVDASGNVVHFTQDIAGDWHSGVHAIQTALVSAGNSSTANLAAGATFTGTGVSCTGGNCAHIVLKTDKDCLVYVDQSTDNTNWDIADPFEYNAQVDNFGIPVKLVSDYFRVRVTNINSSITTYFRLSTTLVPISEPLPRSLDSEGHLMTAIHGSYDHFGFRAAYTPNQEAKVVIPSLLVGSRFEGTTLDTNYWSTTLVNGGTANPANGEVVLATNTTANGSAKLYSVAKARYAPSQSHSCRIVASFSDPTVANCTRVIGVAWGTTMPTISDGAYFQVRAVNGFSVVTRKGGTETVVASGSFNGAYGASVTLTADTFYLFEIFYNSRYVWFCLNGKLLHTVTVTTATWSATQEFYLYDSNTNSGGSTTNNTITILSNCINTLSEIDAAIKTKYQSGTTAGVVCKYGAGSIHKIIISGIVNNADVILYDNTAASGTILWQSGAMATNTTPFGLDFGNAQFSNGLTLVINTANCNVFISYD